MPGMTPDNNAPWWAPGRPLIISDPSKLTYFARANAVRAGVQNMPGALSGVAVGDSEWATYPESGPGDMRANMSLEMFNSTVSSGDRQLPMSVAAGSYSVDSSSIETPSGGSALDSFFNALNRFVSPPPTYAPQPVAQPSPWPWVIGAGVLGVGLLVLTKKRRA